MIRDALLEEIGDISVYEPQYLGAQLGQIGCRLAAEPYRFDTAQETELKKVCGEVAAFVDVSDQIARTDEEAAGLLNTGKPDNLSQLDPARLLFLRPDMIIGPAGQLTICEIETSPFGLGLAVALDRSYKDNGHTTLSEHDLGEHVRDKTPTEGDIIYTNRTKQYRGQLRYLAQTIFSDESRTWQARHLPDVGPDEGKAIYRAFGLYESVTDQVVRSVVERAQTGVIDLSPSLSPHIEEKALMAMIWDKRWQDRYQREIGPPGFDLLRQVIPPTWIVGEEQYFAPGLPANATSSLALAGLSRAKRQYVLKVSGFDHRAAWCEGVTMLHQLSADNAAQSIHQAKQGNGLHIIQEFRQGVKQPIKIDGDEGDQAMVRLRVTPYINPDNGKIMVAKATGRSGTDYIHGSSDSINCAVGVNQ